MKATISIFIAFCKLISILSLNDIKNQLYDTLHGQKRDGNGIVQLNLENFDKMMKETHSHFVKIADDLQTLGKNVMEKLMIFNNSKKQTFDAMIAQLVKNEQILSRVENMLKDKEESPTDYLGCYLDDSKRHLKHKIFNMGNLITLAKCKDHCHGYKYVGLQAGTYCLCGNELHKDGYPSVSEYDCSIRCPGEPNRMCGASWRSSIYRD